PSQLWGAARGGPAFDNAGRLIHRGDPTRVSPLALLKERGTVTFVADSLPLLRYAFGTNVLDTVSYLRSAGGQVVVSEDSAHMVHIVPYVMPLAFVDGWAVRSDGVVAVIRGRSYQLAEPTVPRLWSPIEFPWKRLDDSSKKALSDSVAST